MKKIPFVQLDEDDEFWCGARFIKTGTTLNKVKPDEDYYEYMLFLDLGNTDSMICAHIDKWEAGTVVSYITKSKESDRHVVTAKQFKRSMILPEEIENWFFVDGEIRQTRIKK